MSCFFSRFCHALLLTSMHCGLLGGELSELLCLKSVLHVTDLVVCFAMLCCLFSMHCGLLESELIELPTISSKRACFFFYCGLCLPCTIVYSNLLWITSRWVNLFLHFKSNLLCPVDFVVCLCHALLLIVSMHCWLLGGEFSEFMFQVKPACLFVFWFVFTTPCCLFQCTVDY